MTKGFSLARPMPYFSARGLSRVEAARYVGVSPSTFDKLVAEGRMPRPAEIGARRVYDRTLLDSAFDALGDMAQAQTSEWDA